MLFIVMIVFSGVSILTCTSSATPDIPHQHTELGAYLSMQQLHSNSARKIYIDPVHGNDTHPCLVSNSANDSCRTLSWAFNVTHRANATTYILATGTHYLNESTSTFQNLENITFLGSRSSYTDTTILCTMDDTGLAFEDVTNIEFSQLTFFNCSALRNSTSRDYGHGETYASFEFLVAIYFYSCQNVSMNFVTVDHSPGATGVVMYDTNGTNTISNSVFSNNSVAMNDRPYPGGGGFYVEFTYCIPGGINCQSDRISYTDKNAQAHYSFENCSFVNNNANTSEISSNQNSTTFIVPYRADHVAFGRGGGLSIFMKGNANWNVFSILNCSFTNNTALWGAGLFVEFHDDTFSNVVNIVSSRMHRNKCFFTTETGTGGGGMRLGHYVYGKGNFHDSRQGNSINMSNCSFFNNSALNGGGLSISPTVQNVASSQVAKVYISDTTFNHNYARLGAALHIDRFVMILDGQILTVVLKNCSFAWNSVNYTDLLRSGSVDAYQVGVGAVYVNQVPVSFKNTVTFTSNYGSALVAVGTSLNFSQCEATFTSNTGNKGGAIALLGMAYLRINDDTNMTFLGNVATVDGGAIYNKYIERENLISYGNCFIRHTKYGLSPDQWKSQFYFVGNTDQSGHHSNAIHTTSVLPCAWAGGSLVNTNIDRVFCWNDNWSYNLGADCIRFISSDVGKIVFNSNDQVIAFPGRQFNLPITIQDDLNHSVSRQTVFSSTVNSYHNSTSQTVFYIGEHRASINGSVNTTYTLLLDSLGDRIWHSNIEVILKNCPPGFKFDRLNGVCGPSKDYRGTISFAEDKSKAYLKNDNWMGTIEGYNGYVVAQCPPMFCHSNKTVPLPNSTIELDETLCGTNNRNGTLCGSCKDGFAVAVNSPYYECIECNTTRINLGSNIAKYIAAIYIPLAAFFCVIILFNIRLTSAPANAFILFSQVIASTFDLDADGQIPIAQIIDSDNQTVYNLLQGYRIPYGIFNLQFIERFIPHFCLGDLNTLQVIALDYIVAIFPLVMIVIVLIFFKVKGCFSSVCQCCRIFRSLRINWNINEAILPAFAAFLLLSYNKFSMTSSYLVGSQSPLSDDGQALVNLSRVYYAGDYDFNDDQYQRYYLIPACFVFMTFVVIPPLLLLDFPIRGFEWIICKSNALWRWYPSDKVHILLDTFQGCYKNKMRFFAGLYFVFRLTVSVTYIMTDLWLAQYIVQQIACLVMIALLVICQPYNKANKIFNIVDPLIFLNLASVNAISFYLYSISLAGISSKQRPFIVQYILVFLPLVYMLVYIIWYFTGPYKEHITRSFAKLKAKIFQFKDTEYQVLGGVASDGQTASVFRSLGDSVNVLSEEEALLRRAESRNTYRPRPRSPTSTVVGIDGMEGEATTIQTISSEDSGLRSVQTTSNSDYGSTGTSTRSNSQTKADSGNGTNTN